MRRDASTAEILEQLYQRAQDSPALQALLPTYEAFLEMEADPELLALPLEYGASEARALLERGVPLLQREGLLVFPETMVVVWRRVCDLAAGHLQNQVEQVRAARDWPEERREVWLAMLGQYFRDGEISPEDRQGKDWLAFLLVRTWRPFLRRWAADLAPLVEDAIWGQRRCPVCGGQPDIAYLGSETGERRLVCVRCDTAWRFRRLGCAFCGNQDASTYGYYPDDEGAYRLYACNECHRYLKTLDEREVIAERLLAVERIATLAMDVAAVQAGYRSV